MLNVVTSEIYKIIKSKVLYGVMSIFLVMNLFSTFSAVKEKLTSSSGNAVNESLKTGIYIFQSSYGADGILYVVILFAVFMIISEYINKSIRQMACHGISRWKLVLGQYIALSLISTIIVLGFGYLNLFIFTILFELGNIDVAAFIAMNLGIIFIVWAVCALGVLISHLIRNMGVSIIVSMLLIAGSNFFASFINMLVKNESYKIYGFSGMRNVITDFSSTPGDIFNCSLTLLVFSIIMIILTSIVFTKRDIY